MSDERDTQAGDGHGMVAIFRAPSYAEVVAARETLTNHGLDCTVLREAGVGFTELTDHLSTEEMASFVVVVPDGQEENAQRLVEQLGLVGMMAPEHMAMARRPWVRGCGGFIAIAFVASMVIWFLLILLEGFGLIQF